MCLFWNYVNCEFLNQLNFLILSKSKRKLTDILTNILTINLHRNIKDLNIILTFTNITLSF